MKPQGFIPDSASPSAHEPADLHVRSVVRVAALLAGTLVASILVLLVFFHHLNQEFPGRTSEAAPRVTAADLPPVPRLQTNPLGDLEAVRAVEDSHLTQYGWIDRSRGVAQIPIERAMVLWVKSQAAAPNAAPATGPTELQMRQQKAQEVPHAP
jgi:hypothetical protein